MTQGKLSSVTRLGQRRQSGWRTMGKVSDRSASQLEQEKGVLPTPPAPSPTRLSSVPSSLSPLVRPRWLSFLWQREIRHLIKVSNEELCIFLNYHLSLSGNSLKWDFSCVSSFSLRCASWPLRAQVGAGRGLVWGRRSEYWLAGWVWSREPGP